MEARSENVPSINRDSNIYYLFKGLGRIRSFSEDRKPGQWLPEDQWAVRHPGSTCPDPCGKPKKPPKPSKSWLSICRDPPKPIECDVRHNNCPPVETKEDAPWYSLDNFIPKKKPQEKPPPLQSCREEMRRRELCGDDEEVCENIQDKSFPDNIKPDPSDCCMPKSEPCPAPVVTLSCPLPKELDIMLWCERARTESCRIPVPCQSDRLPYDEFRPQKIWKPPPFSLPIRSEQPSPFASGRCDEIAYAEFKQVDVPRPLYTRYKSVDLTDSSLLFCMTEVRCPEENDRCSVIEPPLPVVLDVHPPEPEPEPKPCLPEKPLIAAGSCRPVRLKKAPKYKFRPKPTKLVERCVRRSAAFQSVTSDLQCRENKDDIDEDCCVPLPENDAEPPKVITGTLTDEPQTFERETPMSKPPRWMYAICKPGARKTPLVPCKEEYASEPDKAEETDGLNFYDGNDDCLTPKPPPDPCLACEEKPEPPPPPAPLAEDEPRPCIIRLKNKFVLMPEQYNIKYSREEEDKKMLDESESSTFEKFIEVKTTSSGKCTKSYPPMKENILYDLQRLCPNPPLDPSKLNAPCRKAPQPDCPRPPRFYRYYSTLRPAALGLRSLELCKVPRRTECDDTSGKCKPRKLIPKPKPCPEGPSPKPDCAEITLPCCPKARIPPDCDLKRPMPICKKKLPPKPSFSECSKDPAPCPKMTECNCWEKKPGDKKK